MTGGEWTSLILSGIALVGSLFGPLILRTWLTARVKHDFDESLERLRYELREREERLKAEIRARESEVSALRNGALTSLTSRNVAMDTRRLDAVEQIWSAVLALSPARTLMGSMSVIKYEPASDLAERDPKARELFGALGNEEVLMHMDTSSAMKSRPFVTEPVWASYSALSALCYHAVLRWQMLKNGWGKQGFVDNDAVAKLIKAALPHRASLMDVWGPSEWYYFYEELEAKLLQDLRVMFSGAETDEDGLRRSADLIKLANEIPKPSKSS